MASAAAAAERKEPDATYQAAELSVVSLAVQLPRRSHSPTPPLSASHATVVSIALARSRYVLGLVLLGIVVALWVASSTLIQSIFIGLDFRQPFFLTFYSTSLFSVYLIVYMAKGWVERAGGWRAALSCCRSERGRMRQERVLLGADGTDSAAHSLHAASPGPQHGHSDGGVGGGGSIYDTHQSPHQPHSSVAVHAVSVTPSEAVEQEPVTKMTVRATAILSLQLCPIWFLMNYFFNLSLNLTSVSSSTILSATSSLFVLVWSRLLGAGSDVGVQHVVGVALTIAGVAMISFKDTEGGDAGSGVPSSAAAPSQASPAPESHHLLGDLIATLGAAIYGFYTVLLRIKIPNEGALDMTLLFGLIGAMNTALFWPGFLLLQVAGVESFEAPPTEVMVFLTINGVFGTVVSDFLWAKSVLLTSPLIASLGLALTMPLAVFVDWARGSLQLTPLYLGGGLLVMAGFGLVNCVDVKAADAAQSEAVAQEEEEAAENEEEQQALSTQTASARNSPRINSTPAPSHSPLPSSVAAPAPLLSSPSGSPVLSSLRLHEVPLARDRSANHDEVLQLEAGLDDSSDELHLDSARDTEPAPKAYF